MRMFVVSLLLATCAITAQAQVPTEALSQCLADNTSGRDRKDLARWVFFAMAAHPEIKQFASQTLEPASDEINTKMAAMFTRLLAVSCASETKAAFKQGGSKAIEVAFQTLGQLAMQELMSNKDVNASMSKFEKLLDQDKLKNVFNGG